jgi:hypothetical protein
MAQADAMLLAAAYIGLSASLFAGERPEVGAVAPKYAPDISGVSTTVMQIGGAVGGAGFGTLYLALAGSGATAAFAIVAVGLAAVSLVALAAAWVATRRPARVRLHAWRSSTSTA